MKNKKNILTPPSFKKNDTYTTLFSSLHEYTYTDISTILRKQTIYSEPLKWFVCLDTKIPVIPYFVMIQNEHQRISYQTLYMMFDSSTNLWVDTQSGFSFYGLHKVTSLFKKSTKKMVNPEVSVHFLIQRYEWQCMVYKAFLEKEKDICFVERFEISVWSVFSCIFIVKQTSNTSSVYKGFPFYTNDSIDLEGMKLFGEEVYNWLKDKHEFYPYTDIAGFTTNKRLFVESLCKEMVGFISEQMLQDTVYLERSKSFWKLLKQSSRRNREFNWRYFQPHIFPFDESLKFQTPTFERTTKTNILFAGYLLALKYQEAEVKGGGGETGGGEKKRR